MPDNAPYYYAAYLVTALLVIGYVAALIFRSKKGAGMK